ncbi:MAG: hypothetical protein ABFR90_09615 [Planctomycetota bacterium]
MKSNTSRFLVAGLCVAMMIGTLPANVRAARKAVPSPKKAVHHKDTAKESDPIMKSAILFSAVLESAVAGPVTKSYPPIYSHELTLTVKEVFRGELTVGQALTAHHQARQHKVPVFPVKKSCVVAVSDVRGRFNVDFIQEATEELTDKARMVGKMPLGWEMTKDQLISPWAAMGKKFWSKNVKGDLLCSKTGRPALLAGEGIKFTAEPVPPAEKIKWTNPDGDGLYKLTITNTSNESRTVAALLTDGKNILWNESVVILCQDKTQPPALCARQIPETVKSVTLEPGQSVSGEINVFGIKGIKWPQGGQRVEFLFCLGEKSIEQSFYYMSKHHDKIRNQAEARQSTPPNSDTAKPSESSADYLLSITFLSDTPIQLEPNACVKVDVWGYDKMVADVSATQIQSVTAPLQNLVESVAVPFTRKDMEKIKYKTGIKGNLGYYFSFTFDTNGDGIGDYRWDYDKTEKVFYREEQTGQQDIQIYLKKLAGT